jgi:hypothetical protein
MLLFLGKILIVTRKAGGRGNGMRDALWLDGKSRKGIEWDTRKARLMGPFDHTKL